MNSICIDYVVPLPENVIMANEAIFDVAKSVGAFAADCIGLVEECNPSPARATPRVAG